MPSLSHRWNNEKNNDITWIYSRENTWQGRGSSHAIDGKFNFDSDEKSGQCLALIKIIIDDGKPIPSHSLIVAKTNEKQNHALRKSKLI